ncbi:MAG: SDR family NAD(P)-dependent oxidoreductase, partial [Planctomycetota bacterium]
QIEVLQRQADGWRVAARCRLAPAGEPVETPAAPVGLEPRDVTQHYADCAQAGLDYGPAFRGVSQLAGKPGIATATLTLPDHYDPTGYHLPPNLADAALQSIAAALPKQSTDAWAPKAVGGARLHKHFADCKAWQAIATATDLADGTAESHEQLTVDIAIVGDDRQLVATLKRVELAKLPQKELKRFFRTVWRTKPRLQELRPLPAADVGAVSQRLETKAPTIAHETGAANHPQLLQRLENLSAGYAASALSQLDQEKLLQIGSRVSTAELAASFRVESAKHRLFNRLLSILAEEKYLDRHADTWEVKKPFVERSPVDICRAAEREHPEGRPEIALLHRCGDKLAEVLRGDIDPLSLLFPAEGGGAADLYRHSAGARALNSLAAEAVAEAIRQLPAGRSLRVIEIGAGTGATTEQIIDHVGLRQMRYVFTDVAPGFLAAAKRRLPQSDQLTYRVLDIEQDPSAQDFEAHAFDLIVAANVLHATESLETTLKHARSLLSPNGRLVLVEGTRPTRWLDLTFGMTDGWWRFADNNLRPGYPLISVAAWKHLLKSNGFADVAAISPVPQNECFEPENHVLVATADASPSHRASLADKSATTIVAWNDTVANRFAGEFRTRGVSARPLIVEPNSTRETLFAELASAQADKVVIVTPFSEIDHEADASAAQVACVSLLEVLQAIQLHHKNEASSLSEITLLTCGVVSVASPHSEAPDETVRPDQTACWGMVRAAARESHNIRYRCVDTPASNSYDCPAIVDELLSASDGEPEIALRRHGRYVARLEDVSATHQPSEARTLQIAERGSLDGLRLSQSPRDAPGPNEVQLRVVAAGLNFRDVLNVLGQYPGTPPLGAECSGVVSTIGNEVTTLAVGDRVVAVTPGAFADYVTVDAHAVVSIPAGLPLEAATTLPVAFGTASLALEEIASIGPGARVLIHAAAGGVGMAALQIVADRGADAFATASLGKQQCVRQLGVKSVYDSRTQAFAEQVLRDTNGEGVDVVLNALSEEFVDANLKALREGGVFVDLTKPRRDIASIVAKQRPDVTYHLIDLASEWSSRPQRIQELLAPIIERVKQGRLQALPSRGFALSQAADAFRLMQRADHTGKLLLKPTPDVDAGGEHVDFGPDDACIITGGFGDLGLLTATTLAERGVGCVALIGRRPPTAAVDAAIEKLRKQGITVMPLVADVADRAQLDAAINSVRERGFAIRGVVHSAGTLDDGLLSEQTSAKIATVFKAKVHGAWNLHQLTSKDPLALFCVYSSVASVLGSPGQTNHSAANAYLDGLVARRRAEGRCGMAINWGPWQGIGEAARRSVDSRRDLGGIKPLSPNHGREAIKTLLGDASMQRMVAPWDISRLPEWLQSSPLLSELATTTSAGANSGHAGFIVEYRSTPEFKRHALLVEHLRVHLATVLGIRDGQAISPTAAMFDLGLDSLTTLELQNSLRHSLGIDVPSSLVFDFPTVEGLASEIERRLVTQISEANEGQSSEPNEARESTPDPDQRLAPEPPAQLAGEDTPDVIPVESAASVWDDLRALEDELNSWDEATEGLAGGDR